ncbi:hypothetical protein [Sabulicella rubraurantiaca]|uniref:hypothetical protein n=1 Tax=Sabulicella rubraurantiaca TaxID=2811429 RepID=UPI001A958577|nr:hypothetical protein [Sabulicella rubraurantiaca]
MHGTTRKYDSIKVSGAMGGSRGTLVDLDFNQSCDMDFLSGPLNETLVGEFLFADFSPEPNAWLLDDNVHLSSSNEGNYSALCLYLETPHIVPFGMTEASRSRNSKNVFRWRAREALLDKDMLRALAAVHADVFDVVFLRPGGEAKVAAEPTADGFGERYQISATLAGYVARGIESMRILGEQELDSHPKWADLSPYILDTQVDAEQLRGELTSQLWLVFTEFAARRGAGSHNIATQDGWALQFEYRLAEAFPTRPAETSAFLTDLLADIKAQLARGMSIGGAWGNIALDGDGLTMEVAIPDLTEQFPFAPLSPALIERTP